MQHQKVCEYPGCSEKYLTSSPGKAKYCPEHSDEVRKAAHLLRQKKRRQGVK